MRRFEKQLIGKAWRVSHHPPRAVWAPHFGSPCQTHHPSFFTNCKYHFPDVSRSHQETHGFLIAALSSSYCPEREKPAPVEANGCQQETRGGHLECTVWPSQLSLIEQTALLTKLQVLGDQGHSHPVYPMQWLAGCFVHSRFSWKSFALSVCISFLFENDFK